MAIATAVPEFLEENGYLRWRRLCDFLGLRCRLRSRKSLLGGSLGLL